jgi:hypothetical protein
LKTSRASSPALDPSMYSEKKTAPSHRCVVVLQAVWQSAPEAHPQTFDSPATGEQFVPWLFPAQSASILHSWHVPFEAPDVAHVGLPAIPLQSTASPAAVQPQTPAARQAWPAELMAQSGTHMDVPELELDSALELALLPEVIEPAVLEPTVEAAELASLVVEPLAAVVVVAPDAPPASPALGTVVHAPAAPNVAAKIAKSPVTPRFMATSVTDGAQESKADSRVLVAQRRPAIWPEARLRPPPRPGSSTKLRRPHGWTASPMCRSGTPQRQGRFTRHHHGQAASAPGVERAAAT